MTRIALRGQPSAPGRLTIVRELTTLGLNEASRKGGIPD